MYSLSRQIAHCLLVLLGALELELELDAARRVRDYDRLRVDVGAAAVVAVLSLPHLRAQAGRSDDAPGVHGLVVLVRRDAAAAATALHIVLARVPCHTRINIASLAARAARAARRLDRSPSFISGSGGSTVCLVIPPVPQLGSHRQTQLREAEDHRQGSFAWKYLV